MDDLHGIFAHTIYGDNIRVAHYMGWGKAIDEWDLLDRGIKAGFYPLLKFVCVRSFDDPQWNTARYRSMETVIGTEV
jgi:hypothetical protein